MACQFILAGKRKAKVVREVGQPFDSPNEIWRKKNLLKYADASSMRYSLFILNIQSDIYALLVHTERKKILRKRADMISACIHFKHLNPPGISWCGCATGKRSFENIHYLKLPWIIRIFTAILFVYYALK